jgi:cell wall-associated NlpC family hydrolase
MIKWSSKFGRSAGNYRRYLRRTIKRCRPSGRGLKEAVECLSAQMQKIPQHEPNRGLIRIGCLSALLVLTAPSCSHHRPAAPELTATAPVPQEPAADAQRIPPDPAPAPPNSVPAETAARRRTSAEGDIEARVRAEYLRWKGTQHRLGGLDRSGIDCSAFVRAVYRDAFGIRLPRTTTGQVRQGNPVEFKEMRAGDLVFFSPPDYPSHVGIYLGKGEFVHASKSKGVVLSPIDRHYWRRYFRTARRILPDRK